VKQNEKSVSFVDSIPDAGRDLVVQPAKNEISGKLIVRRATIVAKECC
jgi:hypothetical protein